MRECRARVNGKQETKGGMGNKDENKEPAHEKDTKSHRGMRRRIRSGAGAGAGAGGILGDSCRHKQQGKRTLK